jgi:uncharacterized membrane protein YvlD (DUF360 family)
MQIVELIVLVISFLIVWLFGSLVLWVAGRVVSGPENAKFTDALWISLLGAIINEVLGWVMDTFVAPLLLPLGLIGVIIALVVPLLVVFIIYIWLIMHFFDTGILGAIAVGLLYFIFMIIIGFILIFIGVFLLVLLLALFP